MQAALPLILKKRDKKAIFLIDELSKKPLSEECDEYFCLLWIKQGKGKYKVESGIFEFNNNNLLFFMPRQNFKLYCETPLQGTYIRIHTDFYPLEKFIKEIGHNGILLYDPQFSKAMPLDTKLGQEFEYLKEKICIELKNNHIINDLLLSYVKIFLLRAARKKFEQATKISCELVRLPEILLKLQLHLELNYRMHHSPSYYAETFNKNPKYINKLVKKHLNKTLSRLIQERIILEAKQELIRSNDSVKSIALGLGFDDVFYFSRLFKKLVGLSPENYRNSVEIVRYSEEHFG